MLRLKGQKSGSDCAVACLGNALALRGRRVGRRRIIEVLGGDISLGIDGCDITRALTKLNQGFSFVNTNDPATARSWIRAALADGPVMLCTRDWAHWELATGRVGKSWASVHDPETGQYYCSLRWLYKNWRAHRLTPKRSGSPKDGVFYAILIGGRNCQEI